MTKQKTGSTPTILPQNHQSLFDELPPLGSEEYIHLMEDTNGAEIPPQVLARAFRQLCQAKNEGGMKATFNRMAQGKNLKSVRTIIKNIIPSEQDWFLENDLEQETWMQIWKVLPTDRGAMAETAWVLFCKHRTIDAWRENFGREGRRLEVKVGGQYVKVRKAKAPTFDSEKNGEDTFEQIVTRENDGIGTVNSEMPISYFAWRDGLEKNQIPLIEELVAKTIDKIEEPLLKQIAVDQFGDDPSPISSGFSKNGKPPLTEQTNLDRHTIARKIKDIRRILAGNLLADKELEFDAAWLRKFVRNKEQIKKMKRSYVQSKRGD